MLPNKFCKAIVRASLRCHLGASSTSSSSKPLSIRSFALHCVQTKKTILPTVSSFPTRCRGYSEDSQPNYVQLPALTNDKPIIYPSFINSIKGFFQIFFVIKPYLDNEFNMHEFLEGTQQAIDTVSNALAREDYDSLQGLVTNDVINTLRNKICTLSYEQKQLIATSKDDIYAMFPHQLGIMFEDDKPDQKFVEIMVVYYTLRGLKRIKEQFKDQTPLQLSTNPELRKHCFILNYRFIREFTKGVESSWTINYINHVMPDTL